MKIYKKLLFLAFPMMAQNFLHSSLTFLDTFMIGQLGDQTIAAAGIAGQLLFIFSLIQYGIHSGISVFTSQYWGKKEIEVTKHLLGIELITGMVPLLFFIPLIYLFSNEFVSLYTKDMFVAKLAASYLRITGISLIFTVFVYSFTYNLRSTGITGIPLISSIISVLINLLLNYLLIFGRWGFPELGLDGAAIGTTAAIIIETVFLLTLVYKNNCSPAATFKEMFSFSLSFFKRVLKVSWPAFMNEFCWVMGVSMFNWIYSTLGTESMAAVSIIASLENFAFTPFFGMFSAGAILVGNMIGEGRREEAYRNGSSIIKFQLILALITGLFLFLFRDIILDLYNISFLTRFYAGKLLIVICLIMSVRILNYTFNVSIFRGGGDMKYSLFLDFSGVWFIGVPFALIAAFLFKLPVYYVMSLAVLEEFYKLILALRRFKSRKWINSLI